MYKVIVETFAWEFGQVVGKYVSIRNTITLYFMEITVCDNTDKEWSMCLHNLSANQHYVSFMWSIEN